MDSPKAIDKNKGLLCGKRSGHADRILYAGHPADVLMTDF